MSVFGSTTLGQLKLPTLVTSDDTISRRPVIFESFDPAHRDLPVWEVCRASSAAPTYFPAHGMSIEGRLSSLIDGGVVANNPTTAVIAEAMRKLRELHFDDVHWTLRHLVVATGGWRSGRDVLVSPHAVRGIDVERQRLDTSLSRQQDTLRRSPLVGRRRRVGCGGVTAALPMAGAALATTPRHARDPVARGFEQAERASADRHLRSHRAPPRRGGRRARHLPSRSDHDARPKARCGDVTHHAFERLRHDHPHPPIYPSAVGLAFAPGTVGRAQNSGSDPRLEGTDTAPQVTIARQPQQGCSSSMRRSLPEIGSFSAQARSMAAIRSWPGTSATTRPLTVIDTPSPGT
jgi:predicted acylesterase/phospholipase RssA